VTCCVRDGRGESFWGDWRSFHSFYQTGIIMADISWQLAEIPPDNERRVLISFSDQVVIGHVDRKCGRARMVSDAGYFIHAAHSWAELPRISRPAQGASGSSEVKSISGNTSL
jgi:hypothetical protein